MLFNTPNGKNHLLIIVDCETEEEIVTDQTKDSHYLTFGEDENGQTYLIPHMKLLPETTTLIKGNASEELAAQAISLCSDADIHDTYDRSYDYKA